MLFRYIYVLLYRYAKFLRNLRLEMRKAVI